jgi:hypothetical protein
VSLAEHPHAEGEALDAFPEFDLAYLFDDPDDPREVTVFSDAAGDDITTTWITIDAEHAVPIEQAR